MDSRKIVYILTAITLACLFIFSYHLDKMESEIREISKQTDESSSNVSKVEKTLVNALKRPDLPDTLHFAKEKVPLEKIFVKHQLEEAVKFYSATFSGRQRMDANLRASSTYFPYIDSLLVKNDLPTDLKYIPVIESEFNHTAVSRAGAVGAWQFMFPTAREYGLRIDRYVDERKNFKIATEKAMEKLRDDYNRLESWHLSMAAYNAGYRRVENAVKKQGIRNYFNLILPAETMQYVYFAVAVKIIMENPETYGFRNKGFYESIKFFNYSMEETGSIYEMAEKVGMSPAEFYYWNPQFRAPRRIPKGEYIIRMPPVPTTE